MVYKRLSLLFIAIIMTGTLLIPAKSVAAATYQNFTEITWTRVANQRYANAEGQGTVLNDLLYSFGGFDSLKACCTPTRRAYVYDPQTDVWTQLPDMPKGVTHAGLTNDGQAIYYAGGYIENAAQTGQVFGTDQVWKYDPILQVYSALPKLPRKNSTGQLAYLNGYLHYIGGTSRDGSGNFIEDLPDHYIFNLEAYKTNPAEQWVDITDIAPLPNPRQHAAAVVLNNKIYYVGGQHNHDGNLVPQKDVHYYDPNTMTWTQVASLPGNGLNHIGSSTVVFAGRIIVLGGQSYSGANGAKDTVLAYDPAANTWTSLTPLPMVQFSAVAGVIDNVIYFSAGSVNGTTEDKFKKATHKGVPVLLDATSTPTNTGVPPTDVPATATATSTATSVPPTATMTATMTATDPEVPATATATSTSDGQPEVTLTETPLVGSTTTPTSTASATISCFSADGCGGSTSTPTATSTSQINPTVTATFTDQPGSTATPTDTTPGIEMLQNGGFEADANGDKIPDAWKLQNQTGDKQICKAGKVMEGACAFQFKGTPLEKAKLTQTVNGLSFVFGTGDTLKLSGYALTKAGVNAKLTAKVKYTDGTAGSTITIILLPSGGIYQAFSGSTILTGASVGKVKVQIVHKSLTGKMLLDGLSLKLMP